MSDALLHYGLFLAQSLTVVIAIILVFAVCIGIAAKGKLKPKEKLVIHKVNDKYTDMAHTLQEAMLSDQEFKQISKAHKQQTKKRDKAAKADKPRLFLVDFEGDIRASATDKLREVVSAILTVATPKDEVLVRLESPGGLVHAYGLAASQLHRLRNKHIPLTVSVDKMAASGGYMMACVANKILAAPFAIIGSVGVIAQLPNFHRWLKKHDVDFEQITAGEFKRTLTMFGENTDSHREKMQQEVESVHELFKNFIREHRTNLDVEAIATGEYWHARQAREKNLVDELITSDDYLLAASAEKEIYEVAFETKRSLKQKLTEGLASLGIHLNPLP